MYVAAGLGTLTKGPVAIVLPALAFGVYLLVHGELRRLRSMMLPAGALIVLAIVLSTSVAADEGMWTFDNVPRADIAKKFNVQITDDWLQKLQRSIVRIESGCTGSFVSSEGLLLTNHHCAQTCIAENSTATRDLVAAGYLAPDRAEEVKCQGEAVSVLVSTENVSAEVTKAVAGVPPADAARTR